MSNNQQRTYSNNQQGSSEQHQHRTSNNLYYSQPQYTSHSISPSNNTQWTATTTNNDMLPSFENIPDIAILEHCSSLSRTTLPSYTPTTALISPASTPSFEPSTVSVSHETAKLLSSAYVPPSPSPSTIVTNQTVAWPSLPSTITKQRTNDGTLPPVPKRRRQIVEERAEEYVDEPYEGYTANGLFEDRGEDDNAMDDDDELEEEGEDEEEEEEEEKELVMGSPGYERKLKRRDDMRFADWMVARLNTRSVYTVLQSRKSGTTKKTPHTLVYKKIMTLYNQSPPDTIFTIKQVTAQQVKNKIGGIKKAFVKAHKLINSSGFGSQKGEGWKKRVRKKSRHYFDLKENWSVAWGSDVLSYVDSMSNLDDKVITDGLALSIQKGKQRSHNVTQYTNTIDGPLGLTQDDEDELQRREQDEDLETYLKSNPAGPSWMALMAAAAAVTRSVTPGPSRSVAAAVTSLATPGPSAPGPVVPLPSDVSVTANKSASSTPIVGGHKDLGHLFVQRMADDQKVQEDRLDLKKKHFDFLKADIATKNDIELKRLALEEKRLDLENKRLLMQQRLDHELKLAELKVRADMQTRELTLNAELRNRGREPIPLVSVETIPPPATPPHRSSHSSPQRSPRKCPQHVPRRSPPYISPRCSHKPSGTISK